MSNDATRGDDAQDQPDDESIRHEFIGMIAADDDLYGMSLIDTSDPDGVPDTTPGNELVAASAEASGVAAASVEGSGGSGRVQVLPVWARQGRGVVPWMGARVLDGVAASGFHVVRSPWYVLRGLGALVRGAAGWVVRPEDAEQFAADIKRSGSLRARQQLRAERGRARMGRFLVAGAPVCAVWAWAEFGQWGILPAAVCAGSYVGLAVAGWRQVRASRSPRERAVRARRAQALSRPFVTEALDVVDCGTVKRPTGDVVGPVILSSSPVTGGEVMVIDLAPGVSVSKLLKRHEDFAGALGRPAECVVIEPQPRVSPGRFELFVAAKRLDEKGAVSLSWGKPRARSFFDPVPVGVDARGRDVLVPLFEAHSLIAGAMGMGKSYSARLLLLWAALDPRARLLIHNLKGGPDYRGFASVAHTLRSGASTADVDALAADLEWLRAEIGRRGRVLEALPEDLVREGKLTSEIASREGMGPIVLLVDEAQRAFRTKRGREIGEALEDVVRTGRAVGVSVHLVTQGTKEGAIPSGILDQLVRRIGHGVTTITDANLILGSDAHGRTYRAVDIDTPGVAYVGTAGGTMVKTAMAKVDLPDVARIARAAAELRREAGTLSGMAAGQVAADTHDGGTAAFLADVLGAWPTDQDGQPRRNATSAELAALLAECDPGEYAGMEGADVSRRMTDAGVKVGSQRIAGGGGRGVKRADVVQAAHRHGNA